jgi:O-antigen ligase
VIKFLNNKVLPNLFRGIVFLSFETLAIILFLVVVLFTPFGVKGVVVFSLLFVFLLISLNVRLTYFVFLILIFLPYLFLVHQAVVFCGVLLFSLIINYKGETKKDLKNPLMLPLVLYILITLPSLINTPEPMLSIRDFSNLIALLIVFCVTLISFKNIADMKNVFYFFILAVLLHSLYVTYLGFTTGKRVFGILNVYYIDFAGLGGVISLILFIYSKGTKRFIFGTIFIVITIGLILTQTRNAWLSFGFAILSLMVFLIVKSKTYRINRSVAVILFVVSLSILSLAYLLVNDVNSKVSDRLDIEKQSTVINPDDPENLGGNSFVSRAFIWHTAVMAYLEHPVLGIGVYAFKHVSQLYYKIPKSFYRLYVVGRTPHVTYLQVLTETGIIGFVFFAIFIISIIRLIGKSSKMPKNKDEVCITLMINWSFVYIIFSMFMTESWLYGQYIVWIGVLLGFLVNNYKLMSNMIEE